MEFKKLDKLPPLRERPRPFVERVKEALADVIKLEDFRGRRGRRGARGPVGEAGPQGETGLQGERGTRGERGLDGPEGMPGPQGERGLRGYKGVQGRQGEVGPAGPVGPKGDKGDKGDPGEDGKAPAHQWQGQALRFRNPDDTWGKYVNLAGPVGPAGGRGGSGASERFRALTLSGNTLTLEGQGQLGPDLSVDLTPIATGEEVLAQRVDEENGGSLLYIGEADPGVADSAAAWRIRRITFTIDGDGDEDSVTEWAGGTADKDKIWDNRLGLSYS